MTRNRVDADTAEDNRIGSPGGYTFHAPLAPDYSGIALTVAVVRLGDHAHLEIESGYAMPQPGNMAAHVTRGRSGRLILRWHEWTFLRGLLDQHECFHIAEVENPTRGQAAYHAGTSRSDEGSV